MGKLNRFLHPYYVANSALVLSWVVFRQMFDLQSLSRTFMGTFVSGELALVISMTLYLYKKFKRCNTWDSFLAKAFLFYQCLVAFMLFYLSLATMIWYILACGACFLLFRQPASGASDFIVELDDVRFESEIESKAKRKDGVAWLVLFTAYWHTECTFFSYTFADIADKFGGQSAKLKFGRIDDRHKEVFDAHKVVADAWKPLALPCVVLFKDGVELLRLPPVDEKGNMIPTLMDYKGCVKYFGLENRLTTLQSDGKKQK